MGIMARAESLAQTQVWQEALENTYRATYHRNECHRGPDVHKNVLHARHGR